MHQAKAFVSRYFEAIVVSILVVATAFAILVAVDKLAFLNVLYIPVLVAAYFLGKRQGVLVAVSAVLMVAIYAIVDPREFTPNPAHPAAFAVFLWGAFLIVTAYVVGVLYEARSAAVSDLRHAYAGILDLLASLIDAVDKYAEDHSVRVADLAAKMAVMMSLSNDEIENIRVGGLLHDIGKVEVSLDVLRKAAVVDDRPGKEPTGVKVARRALNPTGGLLRHVVPLVETVGECFDGSGPQGLSHDQIPRGARILAAADELDSLMSPEPYGRGLGPHEALTEVERLSGTRLDPNIVQVLITVVELDSITA
jgi:hypothetical protein